MENSKMKNSKTGISKMENSKLEISKMQNSKLQISKTKNLKMKISKTKKSKMEKSKFGLRPEVDDKQKPEVTSSSSEDEEMFDTCWTTRKQKSLKTTQMFDCDEIVVID